MLAETKEAVVEWAQQLEGRVDNPDKALKAVAGHEFYNTSRFDFDELTGDPSNVRDNLKAFIGGFSTGARDVIDKFRFDEQITPGDGSDEWYGTPDLWTWLSTDGRHGQRKSVWFSEHYPGGDVEQEPQISTTWRRVDDQAAEAIEAGPAGAPAHGTATDPGGPIISGLDPTQAGCWEVTASYKGHALSYVYWHPSVTVPDVVGVEVGVAETELTRAGHLLGRVNDFDAPFDFALVIAQEPPPGSSAPVGAPVGLRTAVPDPPEQQECLGTAHPRDPVTADALPDVESVTRSSATEAWASLPGREVDGVPTYLGKWDRHAWPRTDGGAVEIVPVDGYQLVVVHESVDDCPDGPPSSTNGVPITHWVLPDDAGE